MAAPDIILVTGKGYLSRFDQKLQKWFQVIPVQGDPENATPVRIMILQSDGFSLKAVHDVNGSVVLLCNFADTIVSAQSQAVLNLTLKDGNKYCMQFTQADEGAQFQMILKSAFEESRRKPAGKPYSSGTKLGGAMAAAAIPPPAKAMEAPRSPLGAASGGTVGPLIDSLKKALATGDVACAREVAGNLAQLKVKTNMMVESVGDIPPGRPGTIKLNVSIEDRVTSGGKVILTVRPNETIATLKRKVFQEYKFPMQVQRWIMGRRIPKDTETLLENGIGMSGATVYLYLVSADKVGVTRGQVELERQTLNQPAGAAPSGPPGSNYPAAPPPYTDPNRGQLPLSYQTLPAARSRTPSGGDYVPMAALPRRGPTPTPPIPQRREPPKPRKPSAEEVGWHCPVCTLINPPTFPGCRVCSQERPADYQVPPVGSYVMDPDEKKRYDDLQRNEQLMQQVELEIPQPLVPQPTDHIPPVMPVFEDDDDVVENQFD